MGLAFSVDVFVASLYKYFNLKFQKLSLFLIKCSETVAIAYIFTQNTGGLRPNQLKIQIGYKP